MEQTLHLWKKQQAHEPHTSPGPSSDRIFNRENLFPEKVRARQDSISPEKKWRTMSRRGSRQLMKLFSSREASTVAINAR